MRWALRLFARAILWITIVLLILVGIGIAAIETGWAKNQIRELIVRQANQYLTATLEIGELSGSLLRGIQLGDIRLSKDGHPLISIGRLEFSYSIRELVQSGVVIKRVTIHQPKVIATRLPDGRWDLGALVRREAREEERTGPGRPIEVLSIDVTDGDIRLDVEDMAFGASHIPTHYQQLNALFSFKYVPVRWALDFERVSFDGSAPDLQLNRLSGGIENGPGGLVFTALDVNTAHSAFTLDGRIRKGDRPTEVDLRVHAPRFAFQEWGGILHGLRNIAVDAQFDTTLHGPLTRLATDLTFTSNAGSIRGAFELNTTVPGWLGKGSVDTERIDLARWLNNPEKPSDITGRTTFDLAFGFGEHFPRGSYAFDGRHAMYMHYAGDDVHARGTLTADAALIAMATAKAYGADVRTTDGSIALTKPYVYHFPGTVTSLDLRRLPEPMPVPHVESALNLTYDVTGTFTDPFIKATGQFSRSEFLGAVLADGFTGTIDTSVKPLVYSGDGEIDRVSIERFGRGLDVAWMQDPRYAGVLDGRFHVEGSGSDRASLRIAGGGRISRAEMFGGELTDADVTIEIADGTLRTSYDGSLSKIDPSKATADKRFEASLNGTAKLNVGVRALLLRSPETSDFDVDGTVTLRSSTLRGVAVEQAEVDGSLRDSVGVIRRLAINDPALELTGSGAIATPACAGEAADCPTDFKYEIVRGDFELLRPTIGGELGGEIATTGRLTGSIDRPHIAGDATLTRFSAPEFTALSMTGTYDVASTARRFDAISARADMHGSFVTAFGAAMNEATAKMTLDDGRTTFTVDLQDAQGRKGTITADALVVPDRREASLKDISIAFNSMPWRLAAADVPPVVSWSAGEIGVRDLGMIGPAGNGRIDVAGTWRPDGAGALKVKATDVVLDTLQNVGEGPARYGGVLSADGTLRGTRKNPIVTGRVDVKQGRFRRFAYERLAGQVDYEGGDFLVDVRLDQSPTVWIAAKGKVPGGLLDRELPERPIDVALTSSPIDLGLVEGLTDVVSGVKGLGKFDVKAVGTSRDPHFEGTVNVTDAGFLVAATGVRYQNGRTNLRLATERIDVDAFHIEDQDGRPLDLHGSLGTHELRVGELAIDATANRFEVIRNEFGRVEMNADLRLRGKFESPQIVGDLAIVGGTLDVSEILDRTLLRPYATQPIETENVDAVAALNPWSRLSLDISLHFPQEVKLVGEDLRVAEGTPIGLGDVNMRVGGDLYLYKDPNTDLTITGSLDRISGTYRFQGRRFDIDQTRSSINFRGDVNPELYVSVGRVISGVETHVLIVGDLHNPELRLSSTPPLDPSDVLALIVFNSTANSLSVPQQQELAVRAATIAAGFFAKPLMSGIERSLGLDILEVEAADATQGTRVTIGDEIAPGLVARFSRQFGRDEFDEATIEYSLSRLFRIRATFSDIESSAVRTPFRRVERAGIDLLLFFSF